MKEQLSALEFLQRLGLANGQAQELKLGRSFLNSASGSSSRASNSRLGNGSLASSSSSQNEEFHTIRYDFKPASIDNQKTATVEIGENNSVLVTAPNKPDAGTPQTYFKGSRTPHKKECVLIIDHETGEITLERLSHQIQVKTARVEGSSKIYKDPSLYAFPGGAHPSKHPLSQDPDFGKAKKGAQLNAQSGPASGNGRGRGKGQNANGKQSTNAPAINEKVPSPMPKQQQASAAASIPPPSKKEMKNKKNSAKNLSPPAQNSSSLSASQQSPMSQAYTPKSNFQSTKSKTPTKPSPNRGLSQSSSTLKVPSKLSPSSSKESAKSKGISGESAIKKTTSPSMPNLSSLIKPVSQREREIANPPDRHSIESDPLNEENIDSAAEALERALLSESDMKEKDSQDNIMSSSSPSSSDDDSSSGSGSDSSSDSDDDDSRAKDTNNKRSESSGSDSDDSGSSESELSDSDTGESKPKRPKTTGSSIGSMPTMPQLTSSVIENNSSAHQSQPSNSSNSSRPSMPNIRLDVLGLQLSESGSDSD